VGRGDHTWSLLTDPYRFIVQACRRAGSDVVETRVLGRRTVCMTGAEAAKVFTDPDRFQREGAAPLPLQMTLFGRGGVQGLDGEAHRRRKALFLELMDPARVDELGAGFARGWEQRLEGWTAMPEVPLFEELTRTLTVAVCDWAGVPLKSSEVGRRTRQLTSLFADAGRPGPRHVRSVVARQQADRWARGLVRDVRSGSLVVDDDSALARVARHRSDEGALLDARTAAVELLNLLRPTVAVSVFIVHLAHALAVHPVWRARLAAGHVEDDEMFVEEVRRFYPFFPATVARVRRDFVWRDHAFAAGDRVLLDLYGTNHDARGFERPDVFLPERFATTTPDQWTLVPQGPGDPRVHHRCPGEAITRTLMRVAVGILTRRLEFEVVDPFEGPDLSSAPGLPRRPLLLRNVALRAGPPTFQPIG
jgi:fatty-acid peroxygenase